MILNHDLIKRKFFFLLTLFFLCQNLSANNYLEKGVLVAAHPLASYAGKIILEQGGSAIDAAVTVQAVLGLVEPQSSGIAGGGFLLYYSSSDKKIISFDGRERAPLNINPTIFEQFRGSRSGFYKAVTSTNSIGVPGIPAMLDQAHKKYGQLNWKKLFEYPIQLAEKGFKITPRFYALVKRDMFLMKHRESREYFYTKKLDLNKNFVPKPIGTLLLNKSYARTLKKISSLGATEFYTGDIPELIINDLLKIDENTLLKKKDFMAYSSKERKPVCGYYRKYKICSMGPPSSGGIAILQILGILQSYNSKIMEDEVKKIHLVTEATRLALADRLKYIGDPDFVEVPVNKLLNMEYLTDRSKLIKLGSRIKNVNAGKFKDVSKSSLNVDIPSQSTTHFVILDKLGNAVSMTSSVESAFGSRVMSEGMILNNQLTDFSFQSIDKNGSQAFNAVAPGKRPMSSMTPTIIFDPDGNLFALVGSPGGISIISYVAQTIISLIDLNYSMQKSISESRFLVRGKNTILEKNPTMTKYENELKKLGHNILIRNQYSGLHGIRLKRNTSGYKIDGGADPRREGKIEFTSF